MGLPKKRKPVKLPPNQQVQYGGIAAPSAPRVGTVQPQQTAGIPKPAAPLIQALQQPRPTAPAPGNPSTATAIDPRDADYYNLLAQNEFTRNTGIASLGRQKGEAQTGYDTLLQRLIPQEQQANESSKIGHHKRGLFFSGILGKDLENIATGFTNQRTDARTNLESTLAGFGEQERNLYGQYGTGKGGDYGLQGTALMNQAVGRQGERDVLAAQIASQNASAAELAKLLAPAPQPKPGEPGFNWNAYFAKQTAAVRNSPAAIAYRNKKKGK